MYCVFVGVFLFRFGCVCGLVVICVCILCLCGLCVVCLCRECVYDLCDCVEYVCEVSVFLLWCVFLLCV